MDPALIYRKTPEGEISISGRSRLREQRLRAVLILIDGETPVGKLCEQFGDKFRPQETISQLEQLGLIEPVQAPSETADGGSGNSSQPSAESLPSEPAAEVAAPTPEIGTWAPPEPDIATRSPEPDIAPAPPEPEYPPVSEHITYADLQDDTETAEAAVSAIQQETEIEAAEREADLLPETAAAMTAPNSHAEIQARNDRPPAPPAWLTWLRQTISRLSSLANKRAGAPTRATETRADTLLKPRRRRSPQPNTWRNWLGIVLLGTIAAIGFVLLALPWNEYRVELEARASALTGQPVRVADMRLELLPYPQVVLHNVTVGKEPLARISTARLTPSVRSLNDLRRLSVNVAVDSLTLERNAVAAVCGATRLNATAASQSGLRSVHIANLALVLPAGRIAGLHAEIGVSPERDHALVTLTDSGGDLRVELAPDAAGCSFTADGQRWPVPMNSAIVLNGLVARGSMNEGGLHVERFDARSADGVLGGSGVLRWRQDARLDLRLDLGHLNLEKALASVGAPTVAHGELDGKLHLTAISPQLNELTHGLSGSGAIVVSRGAIDRFNVVEATRNPGKTAVYGGAFSFDRLTAQLQLDPQTTNVRNLSVNAGALQADGEIAVHKQGRLKGTLYANISSAAHRLRIPIAVAGTLVSPELRAVASAQPEPAATARTHTDNSAEATEAR